MKAELKDITAQGYRCQQCKSELEILPVDIKYMGGAFQVELPRCRQCGFTFIPPELAMGKMKEVEGILEDK